MFLRDRGIRRGAGDMRMAMSATKALRRLCELKQWSLTNLEAQKLLYFAQMIALGKSNGADPLVEGRFQAWDLGPVLPDAYHKAKLFGNRPIKPFIFDGSGPVPKWDPVFAETLDAFGKLTGSGLVAESHWSGGAWVQFYKPGAKGIDIPNAAIFAEYTARTRH